MENALIIDDHPVVSMGMRMILDDVIPGIQVREAQSFTEAIEIIQTTYLDLIVLDISIPGGTQTKMIEQIRELLPTVSVLIFSAMEEEKYALRYIQAGANGFLSKKSGREQYKEAVRALVRNEKYVSSSVQQQILNRLWEKKAFSNISSWKDLSSREMEIAKHLIEGMWTKEIATLLNLKESTISTFKRRIFEKVGVSNTMELAKKYLEM